MRASFAVSGVQNAGSHLLDPGTKNESCFELVVEPGDEHRRRIALHNLDSMKPKRGRVDHTPALLI